MPDDDARPPAAAGGPGDRGPGHDAPAEGRASREADGGDPGGPGDDLPDEHEPGSGVSGTGPSGDAAAGPLPPGELAALGGGAGRGRRRGLRAFTLLLVLALAALAVFGAGFPHRGRVSPPSRGLPPVVQPTGELAGAFRRARAASVRIEARCSARYGGEPLGIGTGFFIRGDGLVLTAYHVVDEGSQGAPCPVRYVAVTARRAEYPLTLLGFDAYHDLAVMRAKVGGRVPFLTLAGALPRPGTAVVAVGDSRDQFLQARAGKVTRVGVHAGRPDFADDTIEMTNSLAPGDSGGPVVNAAGEAVGVVSYISFDPAAMTSDNFVPPFLRGVQLPGGYASYAVPVTADSSLVAALEAGERRDVPVVGFAWRPGFDYDPAGSDVYLGPRAGVIVWQVQPGGPADRAGLRSFSERREVTSDGSVVRLPQADVITAIDGTPTPTFYDLLGLVRQKRIGQEVTLSVERGDRTVELTLKLGAQRAVFTP